MSEVLIWVGLAFVVGGAIVFFVPVRSPATAAERAVDIGKVLEELNKLLDKFDKRYRPGLILMVVGLTLIGLGAWLETKDVADKTPAAAVNAVATVHPLR